MTGLLLAVEDFPGTLGVGSGSLLGVDASELGQAVKEFLAGMAFSHSPDLPFGSGLILALKLALQHLDSFFHGRVPRPVLLAT
jgi:hypothetical protein